MPAPPSSSTIDPAGCPARLEVGYANARTPILPEPLKGPAIFVSHGGAEFPSLIIALQGYGFTIDLVGSTHVSPRGDTLSHLQEHPRRARRQLRADHARGRSFRARRERRTSARSAPVRSTTATVAAGASRRSPTAGGCRCRPLSSRRTASPCTTSPESKCATAAGNATPAQASATTAFERPPPHISPGPPAARYVP